MTRFHPKDSAAELRRLLPFVQEYQQLADTEGIADIFQDNGGKLLQVLILLGLDTIPGREGNDARDAHGREYELKSLNRQLVRQFSTHHHLNPKILAKYRQVEWIFAVYDNIDLLAVYLVDPSALEDLFARWEKKWRSSGGKDLNNPKVPLTLVEEVGQLVHAAADYVPLAGHTSPFDATAERVASEHRAVSVPTKGET